MLGPKLEQHEIANQERRQEVEKENLGGENHRLVGSGWWLVVSG